MTFPTPVAVQAGTPSANETPPETESFTLDASTKAIIVTITIYDTSSSDGVVSGVTWNTTEDMTLVKRYYDSVSDGHLSIWTLNDPTTGTADLQATFGGTVTDFMWGLIELDVNIAEDVVPTEETGTGAANEPNIGPWTVASNAIMVGCFLDDQSVDGKLSLVTGTANVYITDVGADTVGASYREITTGGSYSIVWENSDQDEDWVAIGASFVESVSGVTIDAGIGQQTYTGVSSTITPGAATVPANIGQKTYTGVSASITVVTDVTVNAGIGQATFTGISASVLPGVITVSAGLGQVAFTGITATVAAGASIVSANTGQVTHTGITSSIVPGAVSVSANTGSQVFTGVSASISIDATVINAALGQVVFTGASASIVPGATSVSAGTAQITWTTLTAVISSLSSVIRATVAASDAEVYVVVVSDKQEMN